MTQICTRTWRILTLGAVALVGFSWWPPLIQACPFCSVVANTFSEDIALSDAVVIARLSKDLARSNASLLSYDASSSLATFQIDKILKGADVLGDSKEISTPFFGDAKKGDLFLVMANDPKNLTWSAPLAINDRVHEYLVKLNSLPKEGPERLAFFHQYLEDPEDLLVQDAYDEFARADYEVVKQLKPKMNREQLIKWIEDPAVTSSHRRLYYTMLGVCGSNDDLPLLEKRIRSKDPQTKSGLDALIACYLTLRGPDGMQLIEDLYIVRRDDNFSGDLADVYPAIMALRFHGEQNDVVPRSAVLKTFTKVLKYPEIADFVIPDMARWEDWSQLERLVKLFKTAPPESSYVRGPIISYVLNCPRPEAKKALQEFEEIDPLTVKRIKTFRSMSQPGQ